MKFIQLTEISSESLIIPLLKNGDSIGEIPGIFRPHVQLLIDGKDFNAKLGEIIVLYPVTRPYGVTRIFVVGLGSKTNMTHESIRRAFGSLGNKLRKNRIMKIDLLCNQEISKFAESVFEGIFLGNYRFVNYKTSEKDLTPELEEINVICNESLKKEVETAYTHAIANVDGTKLARDLGNTPSNHASPSFLAEKALDLQKLGINVEVLDAEEIKREEMGLFLAVAQGSLESEPPKLIIMEYKPTEFTKTLCLVGKGITFDTGGISLKPGEGMGAMKYDMCGAAAVIGAMKSIAKLQPNSVRVIGLVPATPNVPDAKAYRPGDIITSRSKKRVEIVSTDAEGRNLLADVLDYAKKFDPDLVIDLATLTGGCVVALGHVYAGFYVNNEAESLKETIYTAGKKSGDYCWQLPLEKDYFDYLKSSHADFKHSGGKWGSSVTAALFLKQFTSYPWIHIDIAGTAWKGSVMGGKPKFYNVKEGATGFGVRLIVEFIRSWK
ncbi:MAG: leucyl aminopeptidase [Candidatus Hodarchaeales archaeon]|jgi:leucyl aminopeptidase